MGKATARKQAGDTTGADAGGDLERLTQQQAAWLIGRPASWLRDNSHLDVRNGDGTYHGRRLLAAVQGEYRPAELPDADLEPVRQILDEWLYETSRVAVSLQTLQRIERTYGAPGMAAIGATVIAALSERLRLYGEYSRWTEPPKTRGQLEAEAAAWIDGELAKQADHDARAARREVLVCDGCGRYRWGRSWRQPPTPTGYATVQDTCPTCWGARR
ncbi:MAG: hypothetical protein CMJ58_05370 [Planctomycetaceae bacterium]|nr:hypothetical protein [Planctomycetaceae bacterium]